MEAGHAGNFETNNVSTYNGEESDEQLAARLQVQINAQLIRDQRNLAEFYQLEENDKADFESEQLAASIQICDTLVDEDVDQSLAARLHTEETGDIEQGDQSLAAMLQTEEAGHMTQGDQSLADRLQTEEAHHVVQGDQSLAARLQTEEAGNMAQGDHSLADRLQTEEAHHMVQGDREVASSMVKDDMSQQEIDDERMAREMHNRDIAYKQQLDSDVEFAQRLAEEEKSKPGLRHERGMGLHPAFFSDMDEQQQRPERDSGLHPFLHRGMAGRRSRPRYNQRGNGRNPGPTGALVSDSTDGGASLFPFSPDMQQQQGASNLIEEMQRGAGPQEDDYEAMWELEERMGEVKDRGMNAEEINTLPTSRYSGAPQGACAAPSADADNAQCKVCLYDFENGQTLRTLPCLHKYHKDCIDQWIKSNATCPVCRVEIKEEIIKAVH